MKQRLDQVMANKNMVQSRSQAENLIKLGKVTVNDKEVLKPGTFVSDDDRIALDSSVQYVSRAGLKLASVADTFSLDFAHAVVLDVGSSTGGFTDFALKNRAKKVYAVDVGTDQLHPTLRKNQRIELHEKTDIRKFKPKLIPSIVVIDVSFISLRDILPHIANISGPDTQIVAMVKPQFEAGRNQTNKGIIKNSAIRRRILQDFELWSKQYFVIRNKADSQVSGAKGNLERFYLLSKTA
ncbi:MAG: TlyA family RNA methyltransferase [Candidatus Saccharimonadales bacterium]